MTPLECNYIVVSGTTNCLDELNLNVISKGLVNKSTAREIFDKKKKEYQEIIKTAKKLDKMPYNIEIDTELNFTASCYGLYSEILSVQIIYCN